MQITGTATDPLGLSDQDVLTAPSPSGIAAKTMRSSFFANRVNWSRSTDELQQGPESSFDPYNHLPGPYTFGFTVQPIIGCRSTGMRVMKMPAGHGHVTAVCWNSSGVVQQTAEADWISDGGGWFDFEWPAAVNLLADEVYTFGYHYAATDQNWAFTGYVWNNGQDTCVYPLLVLGSAAPSWLHAGPTPTFSSASGEKTWHNYYIDPVIEWDVEVAGYSHGTDYYDQFPNGGSRFPFPLIIDFADQPYFDEYKALGMNTLSVTEASPGNIAALKAADMDWYPMLHANDMRAPMAVAEDPVLANMIRGYFLTDEPEFSASTPPATVRTWRNNCRKIDSTRPIHINLGRMIIENQGFGWQPVGITAKDVNLQWREFLSLADIGSMDGYGISRTYPYTYSANDSGRYGIWIYPLQIHRMRTEMTDGRIPIWGEVETTSSYVGEPTPQQVDRAVWSMLIAGAKGMLYFDHRFSSPTVSQDFNAMIHDPVMGAAISDLNSRIIALADALNADETYYIKGYSSTGTLAKAQGGYPAGASIPMHYSSRVVGGTTYFLCQSIRDGSTTATFYVPGFNGATLDVINESRTVTVDDDGYFTDTFTDGDYEYHLYSTTATPSFSSPSLVSAPAITDDGTPETGETVICSPGVWDGVPSPTFTYQWMLSTDSGSNWTDIPGATSNSYTLQASEEGFQIRCHVTAMNSEGSNSANSNVIEPSAPSGPPASAYPDLVLAKGPTMYCRLKDYSDASANGHNLTVDSGTILDVASVITDPSDGSKSFDNSGTARMSTPDASDIRNSATGMSVEVWLSMSGAFSFYIASKVGDFRLNSIGTGRKFRFSPLGAGGWYTDCDTVNPWVDGVPVHVVGTWDYITKIIKIYMNGVLENTVDASTYGFTLTPSGWGPLVLGQNTGISASSGYSSGPMDEFAFYPRALTAAEILENYNAGIA